MFSVAHDYLGGNDQECCKRDTKATGSKEFADTFEARLTKLLDKDLAESIPQGSSWLNMPSGTKMMTTRLRLRLWIQGRAMMV